jgi:plastocyanin
VVAGSAVRLREPVTLRPAPLLVTALVAAVALVPATPSAAVAPVSVRVKDNVFRPDSVRTDVFRSHGDILRWTRAADAENPHNVRQDDLLFRSGSPTTNSDFSYKRKFSAGIFHYYCEQHGSPTGGMDGLVRVPPFQTDLDGPDFRVHWAADGTNTGKVFDVRYRIDDGPWATWQTDTDQFFANFRDAEHGHEYAFQARSQKSRRDPDAVSKWSPKLRVTT